MKLTDYGMVAAVTLALMVTPTVATAQAQRPLKYEVGGVELAIGERQDSLTQRINISYDTRFLAEHGTWGIYCKGANSRRSIGGLRFTNSRLTSITEFVNVGSCDTSAELPARDVAVLIIAMLKKISKYSGNAPCKQIGGESTYKFDAVVTECGRYFWAVSLNDDPTYFAIQAGVSAPKR